MEAAEAGVVITAFQIVKTDVSIKDIATVAQGIYGSEGSSHRTGGSQRIAPGIVAVLHYRIAAAIENPNHIALQIGDIVVNRSVVLHRQGCSSGIVGEVQHRVVEGHPAELAAVIHIGVGVITFGSAGAHTVCIVGVGPSRKGFHLPPMLPGVFTGAYCEDIARTVEGEAVPAIVGDLVAPVRIGILVIRRAEGGAQSSRSIFVYPIACHVAASIISPGIALSCCLVIFPDQLVLAVIDIGCDIGAVTDGSNISVIVVGVGIGDAMAIGGDGIAGDLVAAGKVGEGFG